MERRVLSPEAEAELLGNIRIGDRKAFDRLYHYYAENLLQYIYRFTKNKEVSEDILQDIFTAFWNRRTKLDIQGSLKSYLFAAARYQVMSHMRSVSMEQRYALHFALFLAQADTSSTQDLIDIQDLQGMIEEALLELPLKCREAFRLSRFEQKSTKEIAAVMGISPRTVENYLTTALRVVRKSLRDYIWLIILFYK